MKIISPHLFTLFFFASSAFAVSQPAKNDILEYASSSLLSEAIGLIKQSGYDLKLKKVHANNYYSFLYFIWFSGKVDSEISNDLMNSYFRAFTKTCEKFQLNSLIHFDDPLSLSDLTENQISQLRQSMMLGKYWDWVIAKIAIKQNTKRLYLIFGRRLMQQTDRPNKALQLTPSRFALLSHDRPFSPSTSIQSLCARSG